MSETTLVANSEAELHVEHRPQPPRAAALRELLFKFLIVGDFGVGKTAIVKRYTEDNSKEKLFTTRAASALSTATFQAAMGCAHEYIGRFSSSYKITIGADFAIKQLVWDRETKINLQLWDIAGHERFGYMTRVYYKYAVAAAVVFDLSRIATFQSVQKWVTDIREKVTLPDGTAIPIVLLANKCDIPDAVVPTDAIKRFCRENNIAAWYITSAKQNVNIEDSMRFLVSQVLQLKAVEASRDHIVLQESGGSDCSGPGFGIGSKNSPCSCG
ncbi:hypothetical protein B566_EDAN010809 [Ephemera danica]|nr:hypothetical protein B566_EDAN010809 [Ephemera danica]